MTAQEAREISAPKLTDIINEVDALIKIMAEVGHWFASKSVPIDLLPELKKHYEENDFKVNLSDVTKNYFEVNW